MQYLDTVIRTAARGITYQWMYNKIINFNYNLKKLNNK